ncbi:MAG: hypothetical protein IH820_03375 [Bacteroidetes bacterium]|nr:hypothetical protein [Bacteroidota bacterium]
MPAVINKQTRLEDRFIAAFNHSVSLNGADAGLQRLRPKFEVERLRGVTLP